MQDYYLAHHGVKGMKWGIRKDKSSSGSSAVKKVIASGASKAATAAKDKIADKREVSRANRLVKIASKNPSKLTESEMEYVNKRIKLENQVKSNIESSKNDSKTPKSQREATKQAKKAAKNSGVLSEKELNDRVNRLQKEKQLKQLTAEVTSPGRTAVKQVMVDGGSIALKSAASKATTYAINKALTGAGFPGVNFVAKVDGVSQKKTPQEQKKHETVVNVTGVWEDSSAETKRQEDKKNNSVTSLARR